MFFFCPQDDNDAFSAVGQAEDCQNANSNEEPVNIEQILDSFRQQWQDELNNTKTALPRGSDEDRSFSEDVRQDLQPSVEVQVKSSGDLQIKSCPTRQSEMTDPRPLCSSSQLMFEVVAYFDGIFCPLELPRVNTPSYIIEP